MNSDINRPAQIPFQDFGGTGPILHFAHANGFPPLTYNEFLKPFTQTHKVIALEHRPLWQKEPHKNITWDVVADDIIAFLDQQKCKKVIGMGHSLGAVSTMFAAIKRPDLFEKIILIEPVFLPLPLLLFIHYFPLPKSWKLKANRLIDITLKRRDIWDTREEIYESYRKKKLFKRVSDQTLKDYLATGIIENDAGKYTLRYSKYWEVHFFRQAPKVWQKLKQVQVPVLGIRGNETDTIMPSAWKRWQRIRPDHQLINIANAGHLVPLELPEIVQKCVYEFLNSK